MYRAVGCTTIDLDLDLVLPHRYRSTDSDIIDRHAFERFQIADCTQSATCNVYLPGHNSGVPGVLSTNPARSSTSMMSARQLTGWLTPRAPV